MTSTQGQASIGPQADGAATFSRARRRRRDGVRRHLARRELLALPLALALLAPAAPAVAQGTSSTGTSGYNQKPPTPTTKTEPKKEVEPTKEKTTPKTEVEPAKEVATTPTATTPKATTLPFTGLNLTWVLGGGLLLLAAGLSIRLALRTRAGR